MYSNPGFPNTPAMQDARHRLEENTQHPSFVAFSILLAQELWTILSSADKRVLNSQAYDTMISKFHQFRIGDQVRSSWEALLAAIDVKCSGIVSNVLLQYCLRSTLDLIMKERNKADLQNQSEQNSTPLSKQDHQKIHYIAGYIPFALIKQLSKKTSAYATQFLTVLKSWKYNDADAENFTAYVREWVKKQDRGYLFKPNWDLHLFFRTLEYAGRGHLHSSSIAKYKDSSLNTTLMDTFKSNKVVQDRWIVLLRKQELNSQASDKLFELVVSKWIKIRCNAYVKVYVDIRKRSDKNISKKGEKGLRKQVDK